MRAEMRAVTLSLTFIVSVVMVDGMVANVHPREPRASREGGGRAGRASESTQLSPEIMIDRQLVRVERLLAADDAPAAHAEMDKIIALQREHGVVLPEDFHFEYAKVALAAGVTERAIASLNEYLLTVGGEGVFYREALELLDSVEVRARRAARWPPRKVFQDCDVCPEMVVLPDSRLALGRYEVTVGEYRAAVAGRKGGAGGRRCEAFGDGDSWWDPGYGQTDRHPVTCVSWEDAQAYVLWLSDRTGRVYRLPSEAEWERAAAGSVAGCHNERPDLGTCPVGSYGSNIAGLSDMIGNAFEWTADCLEGDCGRRVLRGGSWRYAAENLGLEVRGWHARDARDGYFGFRVASTLD